MTIPDVSKFAAWTLHLNNWHRDWFTHVFLSIKRYGFELYETNESNLQSGGVLSFKKGDCYIDISRAIKTESMDLRPGIILQNEAESYKVAISVNTPLEVVFCAVKHLNNNEQ